MKLRDEGNHEDRADVIDLRLAARLRTIADSQRAPRHLRERIYAGIAAESFAERRQQFRWDLVGAGAGGALLAAAAAFAIWLAVPANRPQLQAESWVDIALNQVTGGAMMQTDEPESLRSWFESQVDYEVDVPDIPDAVLLGGRLAYVGGIRGAVVEYDVHGQNLVYLMVPQGSVMDMLASQGDTVVTWSSRGYEIVMWKQGGGTRALLGPLPQQELYQIADHCRRTMT
ncbi:MAG: hypothetical protein IID06_01500 [Gemmatimonadetes bacterium]|nr:hypothetical protein [Gemmatimonadota bacterium]